MFDQFIRHMERELTNPLPGRLVQLVMAPSSRKNIEYSRLPGYSPRVGGVLLLFYPVEERIKLLMILRAEYKGIHSGQVSFPGGKFEPADGDIKYTALRETYEETGIAPHEVKIIGRLTELYIPPSNFLVHPFVGYADKKPLMRADKQEVEELLEVDLHELADPGNIESLNMKANNGMIIQAPCYKLQGRKVWGATAMIICELNEVLKKCREDNRKF